ncbi:hypothetical protein ACLB2K_012425 [Fragaria x ananassa]
MDADAAKTARESLDLAFQMSNILETGLDHHTLSILIALCDLGLNPEALAAVVKELQNDLGQLIPQDAAPHDKTVELPKELVRKILLHLPTFEKVVRYKVVSRSWSAIISDPWFVGAFLCRGNRRISPKEFLRIGDEFLSNVAVYSSSRFPHMMLSALFWKEYKGYMSLNQRHTECSDQQDPTVYV